MCDSIEDKMFRSRELKTLFGGQIQNSVQKLRLFSAQAAKAASPNFKDEWNNAKPYGNIPSMSKLGAIKRFMPGGKFS